MREGCRFHASATETCLEFLIRSKPAQVDGRLAVQRGGLRAVVERKRSVARHCARHLPAIVTPVKSQPRAALPRRLVLQVRSHVEGFVVVNAEGIAILPYRRPQPSHLRREETCSDA